MGRNQRRPPNLDIHLHGELRGRVAWELRNADGSLAASGEQSNLILNRGLDVFGTDANHTFASTSTPNSNTYFSYWRRALAVGTGSTAPAATQTNLVAETHRSNSDGGFNAENVDTYGVAGGLLTGTFKHTRVITFSGAYNLTEFGFSDDTAANGQLVIRELFRDGGGTPTPLSVQSGQQLKMTHTFYLTVPFAAGLAASFTLTNVGLIQGEGTFYYVGAVNALYTLGFFFNPTQAGTLYIMSAANSGDPATQGGGYTAGGTNYVAGTNSAYVSGTYTRTKTYQLSTAQGNVTHYGWFFDGSSASPTGGYKFRLTNPATFVKSNSNKLTLNFTVTWARGA